MSTDSSVEPGLEGNWMGGKEFYWEATNLIQWEIMPTWAKESSSSRNISKGRKWGTNWMWIQQNLVDSWSSRALDSCAFHVQAGPAHDWLATAYPDPIRTFCWSANPRAGHLVLSVLILLTQSWSCQSFWSAGSIPSYSLYLLRYAEQRIVDGRSWMDAQDLSGLTPVNQLQFFWYTQNYGSQTDDWTFPSAEYLIINYYVK